MNTTTKRLVVGNWKMNPPSLDDAKRIARGTRKIAGRLAHTEVTVCPPFAFISAASSSKRFSHFHIGAQSVSPEEGGPHTGQVSAAMLRSLGVEHAIVGHSEERARGDTDETVSRRGRAALDAGLSAVVCVGERSRDENGAYLDALKKQIKDSLAGIPKKHAKNIILAYEPVWAIGAAEAMKPEDIHEMSIFARKVFSDVFGTESAAKVRVLYGGSVNFRNASDIIRVGKVNGLLVGRESVNLPGFVELLKAVDAAV